MKVDIDTEELEMLIDFQRQMIAGAIESGEQSEARNRKQRLAQLESLRKLAA